MLENVCQVAGSTTGAFWRPNRRQEVDDDGFRRMVTKGKRAEEIGISKIRIQFSSDPGIKRPFLAFFPSFFYVKLEKKKKKNRINHLRRR